MREVFEALDRVEGILSGQRYLTGSQITEADVRLYTSLVRFDPVYVGHFKVSEYHSTTIFCSVAFEKFYVIKLLLC